jgi:hypothetical protein
MPIKAPDGKPAKKLLVSALFLQLRSGMSWQFELRNYPGLIYRDVATNVQLIVSNAISGMSRGLA